MEALPTYIDIASFCCFAIVTKLFQLVSKVLPKYHDLSRASVSRACGREIALAHSVRALNFPNAEGQKAQTQSSNRPAEPDKVCKTNSPCAVERHFSPRELTISSSTSRDGECKRVSYMCIRSIRAKYSFDLVPELPKHIAKACNCWSLKSGTRPSTAERQSVHKEEKAMGSCDYSAQKIFDTNSQARAIRRGGTKCERVITVSNTTISICRAACAFMRHAPYLQPFA